MDEAKEIITAAEEMPSETEQKKAKIRKRRRVRRAIWTVILLAILAVVVYFAVLLISIKSSASPVGYWVIKESSSNGVTMTQEDAEAIGLSAIGSIKLNESGSCKVVILDEDFEGVWTSDDDGNITITYDADGEEKVLNATIDDDGKMTAHDDATMEYTLEK